MAALTNEELKKRIRERIRKANERSNNKRW